MSPPHLSPSSAHFISFPSFARFSSANSSGIDYEDLGGNGTQLQWTQQSNQTGRLIVETLDGLELNEIIGDEHASAVHRLIVAAVVISLISGILISTVILFRCYMLYCQDYLNIRRFQRPPIEDEHDLKKSIRVAEMTILSQPEPNGFVGNAKSIQSSGTMIGFERKLPHAINNRNASFRLIFDDSI